MTRGTDTQMNRWTDIETRLSSIVSKPIKVVVVASAKLTCLKHLGSSYGCEISLHTKFQLPGYLQYTRPGGVGWVGLTVIIRPVSVPNWTGTELANLNWAWQYSDEYMNRLLYWDKCKGSNHGGSPVGEWTPNYKYLVCSSHFQTHVPLESLI